jgi:hypothetical protein
MLVHGSVVDLRPEPGQSQENFHGIKNDRMRKLEVLGLARRLGPAVWSLSENVEEVLRELGERNDIVKGIHRGLTEKERDVSDFVLHGETEPIPMIGRLVARGLDDELSGLGLCRHRWRQRPCASYPLALERRHCSQLVVDIAAPVLRTRCCGGLFRSLRARPSP